MQRRTFLMKTAAGTLGIAGALRTQSAKAQSTDRRPNILWLSAEDISPLLGCYGDRFAHTPHLDTLASEGVRYERAYAHAPVCSPSRSGIITGVYPSTLGTHQHRSHATLPSSIHCFTEYLRQAGYYCSNNNKKDYNFDDSPDAWDDSSRNAHWRNRKAGQPFFSVFNHTVTHESLLHKTDAECEDMRKHWNVEPHDPKQVRLPAYHPDTPEFREDWARYYDAVTALDSQILERLKELEADGLADSTIVMFWGDHGTGITRGKRWLYESGTRIPLIIRFPKAFQHLASGQPGHVEKRFVCFIDLAPTILSVAGIPIPGHMQGKAFLGTQESPPRDHVVFIRDRMDEVYDCIRSIREGRFRYIRNFYPHFPYDQYNQYLYKERSAQAWHRLTGKLEGAPALFLRPQKPMEELFDTEADPDEVHDLSGNPDYRTTLLNMRHTLEEWMIETHDLGLLDESEMYRRAADRPAMELGGHVDAYNVPRILDTANLALNGDDAVPEMLSRLKDPDSAVRYWAATGLAIVKPSTDGVRDALRAGCGDECPSVRMAAAHALCRLGDHQNGLPVLANELAASDKYVCLRALNLLALQRTQAAPAIKDVEKLLTNSEPDIRRAAESALVWMTE